MANASERNKRALQRLIRERQIHDARATIRAKRQVLKDPTKSKDQKYRARKAIRNSEAELATFTSPAIIQASNWEAYRHQLGLHQRTENNARQFLSGFGTPGARGIPNGNGGYLSSRQQQDDRDGFLKYINRNALKTLDNPASNRIYSVNETFWDIWRQEYADAYL